MPEGCTMPTTTSK
uniref:Uncharacterized protein n=1 Tax=Moniliophthora roreri TaxID=221103 RepID=A0A0W0FU68_MONRR